MKKFKICKDNFCDVYETLQEYQDLHGINGEETLTISRIEIKDFNDDDLQAIGILYTLIDYYYNLPSHGAGGILHILLDDNNYHTAKSSLEDARKSGDKVAELICLYLTHFTEDEIDEFLTNRWRYLDKIDKVHQNIMDKQWK